jgi:hypothetical protein
MILLIIQGPFLCEKKSYTCATIQRFFQFVLTQFHITIQCMLCDNGGYFLTSFLRDLFANQTERYIKLPSTNRSSEVEYSLRIIVMIKTSQAEGATGDGSHSVPPSNFLWCWSSCLYFSVSVVVPPPSGSHERVIYIIDFRKIPRCR